MDTILLPLAALVAATPRPLPDQTVGLAGEMDITLAEILQIVPGLVYAVLVILIYRDGAKQMDAREQRLSQLHQTELDRLNAVHNARHEDLQTLLDKFIDENRRDRLVSQQLREFDQYLKARPTKPLEG